jgi:hypothetical protein
MVFVVAKVRLKRKVEDYRDVNSQRAGGKRKWVLTTQDTS